MLSRNDCRYDVEGHIRTVCTRKIDDECDPRFRIAGAPAHSRRAQEVAVAHCLPYDYRDHCAPPSRPRSPRILMIILWIFLTVLIAILIMAAINAAWRNGKLEGIRIGELTANMLWEVPVDVETPEGGPCKRMVKGFCKEALDSQDAIQWARYYLRLGDARSALKDWNSSREYYRAAIDIGSSVGAQAAIYAAKRIQYQSMTCEYTDESLARVSRDFDKNALGALIEMRQKQQSLKSLGYYNGDVDNRHGPATRAAVRDFQDDLWFDKKGVLTAEQTVLLVCAASHVAKDAASQNVLGIMYAGGLGVRQNTDFALDWLESSLQRGNTDAAWNLALMYGTGTVLSSVQVCDAVQNAERADSYLKEAADAGHPAAKIAAAKYPKDTPEDRWRKLSGDLNRPEIIDRVGRGCNPND